MNLNCSFPQKGKSYLSKERLKLGPLVRNSVEIIVVKLILLNRPNEGRTCLLSALAIDMSLLCGRSQVGVIRNLDLEDLFLVRSVTKI